MYQGVSAAIAFVEAANHQFAICTCLLHLVSPVVALQFLQLSHRTFAKLHRIALAVGCTDLLLYRVWLVCLLSVEKKEKELKKTKNQLEIECRIGQFHLDNKMQKFKAKAKYKNQLVLTPSNCDVSDDTSDNKKLRSDCNRDNSH